MKKYLLAGLIVLLFPVAVSAQVNNNFWKMIAGVLQPVVSTWNVYAPANLRFDGEIQPDGSTCVNGQILKKTGANDWDCASDATGSGGGATTTITSNVQIEGPDFTFATGTMTGLDLNITGSGSTVTFSPSLQGGYVIPLTASTTEWNGKLSTTTAAATYVTSVSGTGNIASSGGLTPQISFTGVLPLASGGIGTTTLGSLTVSSSNLSITGGQSVLIGTSTQITLTNTPSFTTLTVTATTTLAASTTINGLNYFWPASVSGTKILQNDGSGNLSWVSDQAGGGGSLSGGTKGLVGVWASSTGLTTGILIDNGTVAGVNASSSTATFNIQGSGTLNPLVVASSTGTAMFSVLSDGGLSLNASTTTYNATNATAMTSTSSNIALYGYNTLIGKGTGMHFPTFNGSGGLPGRNFGFTLIGYNAGHSLIPSSTNATIGAAPYGIVAIGDHVLEDLTVGAENTFVGSLAGRDLTSGSFNVGIGLDALHSATSSDFNTAVGNDSLAQMTTGGSNTGIGVNTMFNLVSGSVNTAVGVNAGFNNIDGSSNVYMGSQSGVNLTTGSQNVIIGSNAAQQVESLTDSTVVGYNAGFSLGATSTSSQIGNALFGYQAGVGLSTGNYNSVFGYAAGGGITSGSNNVFYGYRAGDNITTGSNNIVIGNDVEAASTTASNTLDIGNLIYGTGVSGTTLVSPGSIGIGSTTPAARLSVKRNSGNAFAISDNDDVIFMLVDSNGNLGLATGTPQARLSVVGKSGNNKPLIIASSTGVSLFEIGPNGSTTIANLGTGCVGAVSGSLYIATSTCAGGGAAGGSASGTAGSIQFSDGSSGFNANQAAFVWDNTNKRLGIGTTSPVGAITIGDNGGNNQLFIEEVGSNSGKLMVGASSTALGNIGLVEFDSNTLNNLVIGSHGSSPQAGVMQYISRGTRAAPTATQLNDFMLILGGRGYGATSYGSNAKVAIFGQAESHWTDSDQSTFMTFGTTNASSTTRTEQMRITGAGRVGIGTTTPLARLTVVGTAGNNSPLIVSSSTGVTMFTVDAYGTTTIANLGTGTVCSASGNLHNCTVSGALSGGTAGFAPYWTSATTLGVGKLIDNGTVIGMNATSSTIGFNIQGTAGTNSPFNVASSTGTSILTVTPTARVGINTSTPRTTLHVTGSGTVPLYVDTSGSQSMMGFYSDNFTSRGLFGYTTSGDDGIGIWDSSATNVNLLVTDIGRVGIGTTTPAYKLTVVGTAGANHVLNIASSTGVSLLHVGSNGRVGIGSTTPSALFTVDSNTTNATTTIILESLGTKGSCIKLKDADGTGYTYISANNGTLVTSSSSCE